MTKTSTSIRWTKTAPGAYASEDGTYLITLLLNNDGEREWLLTGPAGGILDSFETLKAAKITAEVDQQERSVKRAQAAAKQAEALKAKLDQIHTEVAAKKAPAALPAIKLHGKDIEKGDHVALDGRHRPQLVTGVRQGRNGTTSLTFADGSVAGIRPTETVRVVKAAYAEPEAPAKPAAAKAPAKKAPAKRVAKAAPATAAAPTEPVGWDRVIAWNLEPGDLVDLGGPKDTPAKPVKVRSKSSPRVGVVALRLGNRTVEVGFNRKVWRKAD